ncbi:MAG: peptidase M64, partial [Candidatus Aminicenantes bacterium]|nr:peptidase M64 [Candidatus Aminicenantes bacterium]
MKRRLIFFLMAVITFSLSLAAQGQNNPAFDRYFTDKTMRIDYYHAGHSQEETVAIDRVYQEGIWAGPRKNLLDPFMRGRYAVKIYDAATRELIYSRAFDSLFGEYKTTEEGLKGIRKVFHESALIPYPKNKIIFAFEVRDRQNNFHEIFAQKINPASVFIIREKPDPDVKVFEVLKNGPPQEKVDVVFVGEGYRQSEEAKFKADLNRFTAVFFSQEPYRSLKDKFNIYGVLKPSAESGCDEPSHGQFRNTALGASFDSFGSERYLLTEDNQNLRQIAGRVPYDAILIMINHQR